MKTPIHASISTKPFALILYLDNDYIVENNAYIIGLAGLGHELDTFTLLYTSPFSLFGQILLKKNHTHRFLYLVSPILYQKKKLIDLIFNDIFLTKNIKENSHLGKKKSKFQLCFLVLFLSSSSRHFLLISFCSFFLSNN